MESSCNQKYFWDIDRVVDIRKLLKITAQNYLRE